MKISHAIIVTLIALGAPIAVHADGADPVFAAVWSQKEGNSLGGSLFIDQSWESLVSHWERTWREPVSR